jgi:SAM-dependent methyltransferase
MHTTSGQASPSSVTEFDSYADGYDAGMDNPLKRLLGNDPAAYLRVKIDWMMRDLCRRPVGSLMADPPRLLDFGCGHGLFLKVLVEAGFAGELHGCDVSREMLSGAARTWANQAPPRFATADSILRYRRSMCCPAPYRARAKIDDLSKGPWTAEARRPRLRF